VLVSHAWLKEGTDPAESERALRAVLAVAPDHADARHNLAVLLGTPNPSGPSVAEGDVAEPIRV